MFEVIVWDYDAAPDAKSLFYIAKRFRVEKGRTAYQLAKNNAERRTGAAVFDENKNRLAGFGLVCDYPKNN